MNFIGHVMDPWGRDVGHLSLKHGLFRNTNRQSLHLFYCCPLFLYDALEGFQKFHPLFRIFFSS